MNWHYVGTRYGKGEWDGVGAIVKRALRPRNSTIHKRAPRCS